MTYQIADGYNNAGGLADISIQPATNGLRAGRRIVAGNGQVIEDGFYTTELVYGYLTATQYTTLLSEFGLSGVVANEVTIRLPQNDGRAFANYNAIIIKPDMPSEARFERSKYLNIRFIVRRIAAI